MARWWLRVPCGWFARKMHKEPKPSEGTRVLPPPAFPAHPWSLRVLRLPYLQIAEQIISERV